MSSLLSDEIIKDVELKKLIDEEKQTRLENEFEKNRTITKKILEILYNRKDFENFLKLLEYLTQRRSQSRESIISMIKYCLNEIYPNLNDENSQVRLLETIIKVTEGKIFVEFEYSQAIRKMTEIHLKNSKYEEAAKLIQDVQIEAFGSLERDYKVDYILFQMKVLLRKEDYIRTLIVSNKIHRNHLNDEGFELLKIEFYRLMIEYFLHEKKYLDVSKSYKILYDFVKEIKSKLANVENNNKEINPKLIDNYIKANKSNDLVDLFQNYVLYLSICPPELERKNMLNELKIKYKKELEENKLIFDIVHNHLSDDIILINDDLINNYKNYDIFKRKKGELLKLFRKYWIQHNLSIFGKFFSQVHLKRISEMCLVNIDELESELADMVVNDYIFAKINRIEKTVNFQKKKDHHDVLDELNYDLNTMLKGLENTTHLINKEYLKYGIKQ
jgi:26S proteasome regulatory subunit N5